MYYNVDKNGHMTRLLDFIQRKNDSTVESSDGYTKDKCGRKSRKITTKGWDILIKWRDDSSTWEAMKDMKESYTVQVAEFNVEARLDHDAAFAWWVPYVLKQRTAVISKIKTKYWVRTHKCVIKISRNSTEAKAFDAKN